MLEWLVPHPKGHGLYCALHTILKITHTFHLGVEDFIINRVIHECRYALHQLNKELCEGKNPLKGKGITKHPIVGVMWHTPHDKSIARQWRMIQAVFLDAYLSEISKTFLQNSSIPDSIIDRFYSRSTSIRALFDIEDTRRREICVNHLASYIMYDPIEESFSLRTDKINTSSLYENEEKTLNEAFESIRLLLGHYRHGGGIGKRKRVRLNGRHTAHLVQEESSPVLAYSIQIEDQEASPDVLPLPLYSPTEMPGRLQRLRIQEHIRRKNQLFVPWALPYSDMWQSKSLYQKAHDIQSKPHNLMEGGHTEILQFISGLIGWPLKQVAKLLISDDSRAEPSWPDHPIILTQIKQSWVWKLALITPNVQDDFSPACPRLRYLTLLDQWGLAAALHQHYGYGHPFELKTFTQKLDQANDQVRLQRFMLFHYGNKDQAVSEALSGDPSVLRDARLYYAQYTEEELGSFLKEAFRHRFSENPPFRAPPTNTPPHSAPLTNTQATGPARFTPSLDDLRLLVLVSSKLPAADPRKLVGRKALIKHYNATLWRTYLLLALSTGVRVGQVLQAVWTFWRAFPHTDFLPISDKSPHVDVNARIVPLHSLLRGHLRYFYFTQCHCRNALALDQLEGFQFIDDDEKIHRIGKRWVTEQLAQRGMHWPDNFHRACVRRILVSSKVPMDEVDFFMGHATPGDQPQSPLSTLSIQDYLNRTGKAIENYISNQLGCSHPDLRPFRNDYPDPTPELAKSFLPRPDSPHSSSKTPHSKFHAWLQQVEISRKGEAGYRRIFTALEDIAKNNAFAAWLVTPTDTPPSPNEIEELDLDLMSQLVECHIQERLNIMELRRALTLRYRLYHKAVGAPKTMLVPLFSPMRQSPFTYERMKAAAQYTHYRSKLRLALRKKQLGQDDLALLGLHAVLDDRIINKHAFAALIALTNPSIKLKDYVIKPGNDLRYFAYSIPTQRGSVPKRAYLDAQTLRLLNRVRKQAPKGGYTLDDTWWAMRKALKSIVDPVYVRAIPTSRNSFISQARYLYLLSLPHAVVASLTGASQDRTFANPRYFPLPLPTGKLYKQGDEETENPWPEEDLDEIRDIVKATDHIAPWAAPIKPEGVSIQVGNYIERWILPLISLFLPHMPDPQDMTDLLYFAQQIAPQGKGYPQKKSLEAVAKQYEIATGNKLDWRPPARIKQTDNSVITIEEYHEALEQLDKEIELANTEEQVDTLQARKLFLIIAFRTGMRRSEILALEKSDFDLNGSLGILRIDHKPHNHLKTQHAKRTLPLKYLIPEDEWEVMLSIINNNSGERLFTQKNPDNRIIRPLIRLIRDISRNDAFVVHHLRHSFATWTHLKIRCARNNELVKKFIFLPETHSELLQSSELVGKLISSNTTQSDLFYIAMLMGHSSPMVSIVNYVHGIDMT